jgi:hypothetical protein
MNHKNQLNHSKITVQTIMNHGNHENLVKIVVQTKEQDQQTKQKISNELNME